MKERKEKLIKELMEDLDKPGVRITTIAKALDQHEASVKQAFKQELLEKVNKAVPKEMNIRACVKAMGGEMHEKYDDTYEVGFNACRQEFLNNLKEL